MQHLEELLRTAVDQSTFDLGREDTRHRETVTFSSEPQDTISPTQLRELVIENKSNYEGMKRLRHARLVCPDATLTRLEDHLRLFFKDYIDSDTSRIGYALPAGRFGWHMGKNGLSTISSASTLDDFTKMLVRGATVLGTEDLIVMISGWLGGQPIKYRTSTLLNGLRISEPVSPMEGLLIEPLPLSSSELPASLPTAGMDSPKDFLGRTVVSIECNIAPPLFVPPPVRGQPDVRAKASQNIGLEQICMALSLEGETHVDAIFSWNDYRDLEYAFLSGTSGISRHGSPTPMYGSLNTDVKTGAITLTPFDDSIVALTPSSLQRTLKALQSPKSERLSRALSRWARSKDGQQGLDDQFIDLRIALEVLYLPDRNNQELSLRMALTGAWHLGNDVQDRSRIYKTLRAAYKKGSTVVHQGGLKSSAENQELLLEAQSICRRGILRLIEEGQLASWDDVILGG